MKRILLASVAVLAVTAAHAADLKLPAKAPVNPFITNTGSGWYVGVNSQASVASSSVSGNTFPSLSTSFMAAGAAIGGDVGYIWNSCVAGSWCQIEVDADYQNISGGVPGASMNSKWNVSEEADIGIQVFQTIIAALPSLNGNNPFPTFNPSGLLPANIAVATTPRQYVGFVVDEMELGGNLFSATGQDWAIAPGVTTGYRWQTLGTDGKPNGGSLNIAARVLWPTKGITLSNVFATGGAPMVTGAHVSESALYTIKLQYDFGL